MNLKIKKGILKMAFKYNERVMFHGNQRLLIAKLDSATAYSDVIFGTGLVSVSNMKDDSNITNFPADDVPDHATISGAQLLKGTINFMQLDPDVRVKFFGQEETANGKGFASVGVYPQRVVQYATLGTKRDGTRALMVTVYPSMSVTSKPSKQTTTDSADKPTAVNWEAAVQASGSDYYKTKSGRKSAEFEYIFYGEDVDKTLDYIDKGGIILPDFDPGTTTVIASATATRGPGG